MTALLIRLHLYQPYLRLSWNVATARTFLRWAWQGLRGQIGIIDSRTVSSRGGYKYLQVEISNLPVSSTHEYP